MAKCKTNGLEWLYLSMASFNGAGYADKSNPEAYLNSYKAYKMWKGQDEAIELLERHPVEALSFAESLVEAKDAGHTPNPKQLKRFDEFVAQNSLF